MKTFNVRLHSSVPKSNQPVQITCDDRAAWRVAMILQHSDPVIAFNDGTDKPAVNPALTKFKVNLFEDEVHSSIMDVLIKMAERVEEEFGGCQYESFVGSPGDFSPPHCRCPRCIAAGRAFQYETADIKISKQMHQYFTAILRKEAGARDYRWGLEFKIQGKCRISIYNQGNMAICSTKPEIRIGVYVFDHKEKAWRSAP